MKTALKTATILSWINLIIGGILVLGGLFSMLMAPNVMLMLISVVLTGSIMLHSYATLQLKKSIINPDIPLSSQTSSGIRLVGFMALFFAMLNIGNAAVIIQNAEEAVKQIELPFKPEGFNLVKAVRIVGVISLIFSIGIVINVMLSFRLLRRYLLSQQEKNGEK